MELEQTELEDSSAELKLLAQRSQWTSVNQRKCSVNFRFTCAARGVAKHSLHSDVNQVCHVAASCTNRDAVERSFETWVLFSCRSSSADNSIVETFVDLSSEGSIRSIVALFRTAQDEPQKTKVSLLFKPSLFGSCAGTDKFLSSAAASLCLRVGMRSAFQWDKCRK